MEAKRYYKRGSRITERDKAITSFVVWTPTTFTWCTEPTRLWSRFLRTSPHLSLSHSLHSHRGASDRCGCNITVQGNHHPGLKEEHITSKRLQNSRVKGLRSLSQEQSISGRWKGYPPPILWDDGHMLWKWGEKKPKISTSPLQYILETWPSYPEAVHSTQRAVWNLLSWCCWSYPIAV